MWEKYKSVQEYSPTLPRKLKSELIVQMAINRVKERIRRCILGLWLKAFDIGMKQTSKSELYARLKNKEWWKVWDFKERGKEERHTDQRCERVTVWFITENCTKLVCQLGWLHGCVICAVTQDPAQKDPMLGLMLCCHHLDSLCNCWTREPCIFTLYCVPQIM